VLGVSAACVVGSAPDAIVALIIPGSDRHTEIRAAIDSVTAADRPSSITAHTWTNVRQFYSTADAPAWVDARSTSRASTALELLKDAGVFGLNANDYQTENLEAALASVAESNDEDADQAARLASLDVEITEPLTSRQQAAHSYNYPSLAEQSLAVVL
jgi:hypothetical protein